MVMFTRLALAAESKRFLVSYGGTAATNCRYGSTGIGLQQEVRRRSGNHSDQAGSPNIQALLGGSLQLTRQRRHRR
jgi:hypothetical protein